MKKYADTFHEQELDSLFNYIKNAVCDKESRVVSSLFAKVFEVSFEEVILYYLKNQMSLVSNKNNRDIKIFWLKYFPTSIRVDYDLFIEK